MPSASTAASAPAVAPRKDVHRGLRELSTALEIEAIPINPQPLAIPQPGPTATSSLSEKAAGEADAATTAAPQRSSPDAVTTSASTRPAAGQITQRVRLLATDKSRQFLPGQPRISLDPAGQKSSPRDQETKDGVLEYMRESHLTAELDGLLPYMKYIFVSASRCDDAKNFLSRCDDADVTFVQHNRSRLRRTST